MHGLLVSNAFLKTGKFTEHYEWLKNAAKKKGIELSLVDNTRLACLLTTDALEPFFCDGLVGIDFVLFWDKDVLQGRILEQLCHKKGIPVLNRMDAIAASDSKFETYYRIGLWNQERNQEDTIPILPTVLSPMTYENIGYCDVGFVDDIIKKLGLPLVIKECFGSFGMQVHLADTKEQVIRITKELAGKSFLYQKYAKASSGRDVRLQVVGNQVIAAMYRFSENGDFRANISNGGSMKAYTPSERECTIAVNAAKALGLDFAGVDLLFESKENEEAAILCEVNSNAHFKNIFVCTGVNVAEYIIEEVIRKCHNKNGT